MVSWDCESCHASEAVPCEANHQTKSHNTDGTTKSIDPPRIEPDDATERVWSRQVTDYSRLTLTLGRDRLPAFAGIAKVLGARLSRSNEEALIYLAKHWSLDLAQQLTWPVNRPQKSIMHKVSEYSAPSWSWACYDSEVITPYMAHEQEWRFPLNNAEISVSKFEILGLHLEERVHVYSWTVASLLSEDYYGNGYAMALSNVFSRIWHVQQKSQKCVQYGYRIWNQSLSI